MFDKIWGYEIWKLKLSDIYFSIWNNKNNEEKEQNEKYFECFGLMIEI